MSTLAGVSAPVVVLTSLRFVVASGTDGVMLDFESPGYWNGTGVVDAVCALKASLEAALPGAMVASCAYPAGIMQGLPEKCLDVIAPLEYTTGFWFQAKVYQAARIVLQLCKLSGHGNQVVGGVIKHLRR